MSQNWKRSTALFLSSQGISLFGSTLVQYAISWHITLETQSGLMMTVAVLCGFLPTCLCRHSRSMGRPLPRKLLIVLSDADCPGDGLAILFRMGYDALWLLFAVSAIRAAWRRRADARHRRVPAAVCAGG